MKLELRRPTCVALVAVAALALAACGGDGPVTYAGIIREPAPDVSAVSLPSASSPGVDMTFRAEPGHLLLAYFGYLSCPDVCPTTMADLRTATEKLSAGDRARVDVVMVTVDPGRDTAESLTAYVRSFVPRASGARTDDAARLRAAADAFGADYRVVTNAAGAVEVSHTAFVYVVDDRGLVRLTWSFGTTNADMRRDLATLLSAPQA